MTGVIDAPSVSGEVAQKVVRMEVEEVVLEDGGSLECVIGLATWVTCWE